jgi:hypothetical protein
MSNGEQIEQSKVIRKKSLRVTERAGGQDGGSS